MDLNSYFKTLAQEHQDILHVDGEDTKAYFRSYSFSTIMLDNEFHKNLRYAKNNILISQFNDDSALPVPQNDYKRQNPSGSLFILSRIIDTDIDSAQKKAIEIRDDIYSRINRDMREGTILRGFQIENINSQTIGRIADNFFGVLMLFTLSESYNATYDQEKWQPQSIS